jgi:flagellar biosynthesis/type III secretory pathway ATPase
VGVSDALLGRVLDGLGDPIDGKPAPPIDRRYPLLAEAPPALERPPLRTPLPLGVRAIDALLTCAYGQRVGIFAGSGVGKSTLMGMIARNTAAEVNVIALIGERGREVREFIEDSLGEQGLQRSVLVDGDDLNDPIADTARAILDGHIVLSRTLTQQGHYPPIDVLASLSRVMPNIVAPEHLRAANRLRQLLAAYRDAEDLIAIGAYQQGTNPLVDRAVARMDAIRQFLRQSRDEQPTFEETLQGLYALVGE